MYNSTCIFLHICLVVSSAKVSVLKKVKSITNTN